MSVCSSLRQRLSAFPCRLARTGILPRSNITSVRLRPARQRADASSRLTFKHMRSETPKRHQRSHHLRPETLSAPYLLTALFPVKLLFPCLIQPSVQRAAAFFSSFFFLTQTWKIGCPDRVLFVLRSRGEKLLRPVCHELSIVNYGTNQNSEFWQLCEVNFLWPNRPNPVNTALTHVSLLACI